jgi:hypothetical protein
MSNVRVVKLAGLSRMEHDALLQRSSTDLTRFFDTVRPIIAAVRAEGDVALARYSAATLRRCGPAAKRQLADVIDPGLPLAHLSASSLPTALYMAAWQHWIF